MTFRKCRICKNYEYEPYGNEHCKYCDFKYDDDLPWTRDDFDVLNMDEESEWGHLQILYRLYAKDIDCLFADIWFDNNVAIIIGVKNNDTGVARALGIHKECIYNDSEHGMMILNLYQEKCLRGLVFDPTTHNRKKWIDEIREYVPLVADKDVIQMCLSFTLQNLRNDPYCVEKFKWKDC